MKYWTEQENNPTEKMEFWQGTHITKLADNEIFLYGSNPQGINGAGAAKAAMSLSKGAKHGIGRGLNGSSAYALVTKSLNAGFLEKSTGILYDKEGYCSVSTEQIRENIVEFYEYAKNNKDKKFLVSYQFESWPNGTPKKSLNGYTSQEMLEMFAKDQDIPSNIVFHDSYKPHLEKILKNKQSTGQLVITEDDKAIDIKEDDIVWTIDSDESKPILSSDTNKGYKLSIKDNSSIEPEMTKEEFFGQLDINPLDYIRVVNVRGNKENQAQPDEKLIAAHRANPTLGNPFVMKDKSDAERDRVIEAYKKHLEKDLIAQGPIYKLLNKIADDIIEKKEKIALSCWCAPQACHAHEIAKVLVLMVAEKRLIQVMEEPKANLKNKP